jgi:hypothetical protein
MSIGRTSHVGRWRTASIIFAAVMAATVCIDITPALAQGQTGTIAGVVRDSSGAVLPGVTVEASSPALIEKTRSAVTDGQGAYKIIDLRPGTYSVSFALAGFSTVRREDITLTASFTANVNADLKVGALEETVTVTGASPIVDTQNVAKISTTTREVMDVLPTDRNFVSFAALTPSVLVTGVRQNVGGSIPETGMNLVVHGSRAGDSLIMVDGMPIINGSGSGGLQYGNYLNNALAQEITFQTDSHNAEFERASVYSNFIPKEGSNTYRGSFAARYAGEGWQSANLDDEQRSKGLLSGSRINRIWDINPALGGPLVKDRVWIYGSYRHWGTYNTVAGSFRDQDFSEFFYQPSTEQNLFPVWHQSGAARLTTQVTQKNKVNLYYDWQYTFFGNCFVPTYLTAISACPEYKNIPQYIRPGELELPGHQQAAARSGCHRDAAGLPRLSPRWRAAHAVRRQRCARAGRLPDHLGVVDDLRRQPQHAVQLSRGDLVRDRQPCRQGRLHPDAFVALRHAGAEQLGVADAARRGAVLAHRVRHADPVPRDDELQRRHLRAGSVAREPADDELRRASRHAQVQRGRAADRGRPVHAGARFRENRERPELEGHRSTLRRGL